MTTRGATPEWQRRLAEKLGENPARFLDHDLVERGGRHTDHTLQRLVRARIRGIDRIETVNAWIAVERKLDRGPRDLVVQLLEDRREYLEAHGERPDELEVPAEEKPDRYRLLDSKTTESCLVWCDRDDGKRTGTYRRNRRFDNSSRVATDGGEDW